MNSAPYTPLPPDPKFAEYIDEGAGSIVRLPVSTKDLEQEVRRENEQEET